MCLVASAIYCLNDIVDVDENRMHPRKRFRPVAKGSVTCKQAAFISMALVVGGIGVVFALSPLAHALDIVAIIAAYYVMNVAYCLRLKHIAIVDVFCIAVGLSFAYLPEVSPAVYGYPPGWYVSHSC